METIQTNTIRTQKTVKELKKNLKTTLINIEKLISEKDWMITVDGKEKAGLDMSINSSKLNPFKSKSLIEATFNSDMSMNSRKNVAKRLWNVQRNPGRRSINALFYVLRKLGIITKTIKIDLSKKEQIIQRKRKIWVKLRNEAELALKEYKKEKGDFYKLKK